MGANRSREKVLGNHRRQSPQSRLELGLRVSWIPAGEQSGLQTRIATTKSISLRADEKLTAFLEEPCAVVFNRAQKVTALDERAALA
jgi:hypothetical protein